MGEPFEIKLDDGHTLNITDEGILVSSDAIPPSLYGWQEVFYLLNKAEFVDAVATENTQEDSGDSNES